MGNIIVRLGQVERTANGDSNDGGRIAVRLPEDQNNKLTEHELAYPLLPRMFQSAPKVGECVLVIVGNIDNTKSKRYYIGPVVTQSQYFENCPYNYGRNKAFTPFFENETNTYGQQVPKFQYKSIDKIEGTKGAFPSKDDIAIIGRHSEDIALREGEIIMRCGVRGSVIDTSEASAVGNIMFNKEESPCYVQLKHRKGLFLDDANSVVNVVADKINLISHQASDVDNYPTLVDENDMIKDSDMNTIMEKLHQVPYGDLLVDALNLIRRAITEHKHIWAEVEPTVNGNDAMTQLVSYDFDTIKSKYVRIS